MCVQAGSRSRPSALRGPFPEVAFGESKSPEQRAASSPPWRAKKGVVRVTRLRRREGARPSAIGRCFWACSTPALLEAAVMDIDNGFGGGCNTSLLARR
jgi:hypothetical protein